MNKNEFLRVLNEQLLGQLSQEEINGHIRYYSQYIENEIRMGKTEEQVMEELGSPILIAKTLSDMAADQGENYNQGANEYSGEYYEEYEQEEQGLWQKAKGFLFASGAARILIPVVIVFVLMIAFWILGTVTVIAFRFFSPILLIFMLYYLFRNITGR